MQSAVSLEEQFKDILSKNSFSKEINNIILTCVDPNYTVDSLGIKGIDVRYDEQHVQISGAGFKQILLVYDKSTNRFNQINANDVHKNLRNGIIQLSYNTNTLVIGIPGDVYSFKKSGTGFAFGNPNYASSSVAETFLKALIEYTSTNRKNIKFTAMRHPDCGLFANNVGKYNKEFVNGLSQNGKNFMESKYSKFEQSEKTRGADDLSKYLQTLGIIKENINIVQPVYRQRKGGPGILKAICKNS